MAYNNSTDEGCNFQTEDQRISFNYFMKNKHFIKPIFVTVSSGFLSPIISVSNGIIFWAILRRPNLRTPANCLICCLSFADFLIGFLYLPFLAVGLRFKPNTELYCILFTFRSILGWIFSSASFFTIVAVSCERCIALFYSLQYAAIVTTKRVLISSACVWGFSFFISIFSALETVTNRVRFSIFGGSLAAGMLTICGTYYRIFKLVRHHHHQINAQQMEDTDKARQRKLAVTMAYVISVSLICYLPIAIVFASIAIQGRFTVQILAGFSAISVVLFSTSSLLNPLIYCLKNQEIRAAVMQLFRDTKNKYLFPR